MSLEEVENAHSIALFAPMADKAEIGLGALDTLLRSLGKRVYYPRLSVGDSPTVAGELVESAPSDLLVGARGFAEPAAHLLGAVRGEVDLVVVPALAVAADGHRLGYGAGFYDRTLPVYCPPGRSVSVAYDFQLLGELPVLEGDVACDIVVTDARVLRPRAEAT
jgi:5-formyltetrahydrofolate cyclo-ligase